MASKPVGLDVAEFLARQDDNTFVRHCDTVANVQFDLVKAYTRGHGFEDDGSVPSDLRTVIITSAARLVTNPTALRGESAESYAMASGVDGGFTDAEKAVLHKYRRRAA
jgi:hypothetical protein